MQSTQFKFFYIESSHLNYIIIIKYHRIHLIETCIIQIIPDRFDFISIKIRIFTNLLMYYDLNIKFSASQPLINKEFIETCIEGKASKFLNNNSKMDMLALLLIMNLILY